MSIFKFIALSPDRNDKFNPWTQTQSYFLVTGPSLSMAFKKIAETPEVLESAVVYGLAVSDITVDQQWVSKEVKARADFSRWLESDARPGPGPVFTIHTGSESLKLWDARRLSESHLEKQVIESRPPLHVALDLLDRVATMDMSMRKVLAKMGAEDQAIIGAALIKRLPLKSKGVMDQSVYEFRKLIVSLYEQAAVEDDGNR
ncbi:hypothetical protein YA0089_13950 [Pseudomonas viridiflava]|uniref:hypothetical protein n=1 Tax=Pseudomonas viridiflava TaxID=33069 RepID=UPI0018E61430|nr:hypothetical protein [Pseudomonas viridiflava]MBI6724722.1 hypothetical protein [Pseudomonas viridiflava]